MTKFTMISMIAAFGVVGAAQAEDEISLSKKTLVEIVQDQIAAGNVLIELLDESLFRQELSEMEGAVGQATAAVLFHLKHYSSSGQQVALDNYRQYVADFEEVGAQTSSRWPDDVLDTYVDEIEDDWRSYKKRSLSLLETGSGSGRLTAKEERRAHELYELALEIKGHLEAVRGELIP